MTTQQPGAFLPRPIFTAELCAIRDAIVHADNMAEYQNVTIVTDSRSAIQGIMKIINNNMIIQEIRSNIHNSNKTFTFCWVPSHVGVAQNELADRAATDIVRGGDTEQMDLPRNDVRCLLKVTASNRWREQWEATEDNKLREIKNHTNPFQNSSNKNRLVETTLTRLRIGHSRLTHGFLMERGYPPFCDDCIVPITIKHILLECPSYNDERTAFGSNNLELKEVLGETLSNNGLSLLQYL